MTEFRMPSLGADMDSGTVTEWLVHPGDTVHKGDIVAVVDTAKSAVEVETFTGGVVDEILVEPGHEVPVGTVLATFRDGGRPAPARGPRSDAAGTPAAAPAGTERSAVPARPAPHRPRPSPLVRRRAAEAGLDLATVEGTGSGGRVTRDDIEAAIRARSTEGNGSARGPGEATPPAPAAAVPDATDGRRPRVTPYARRLAAELGVDLSTLTPPGPDGRVGAAEVRAAAEGGPAAVAEERAGTVEAVPAPAPPTPGLDMRTAIARLMSTSKREIPHYYLRATVDLSHASAWMREHNRGVPITERIVPAALMLRATALASARHPELNGHWVDGGFRPAERVRLGVAISLRGGGLVAPAIEDADHLGTAELMHRLRDLVTRARAGRLRRTELVDPSITVTNLGDQGVESVFGVIYPPQVALVGFGRVVDRPVAVDGLLGVHPTVTLTLSGDHRATDGFTGGRFLSTIDDLLQTPEELS